MTQKICLYEKIIVFSISVFTAFLIYRYSIFFPDYKGYSQYIITGSALTRFHLEFISAYTMYFFGWLGLDAKHYYSFVWMFFSCSCFYASISINRKKWVFLFFVLLLNPFSLILIQTPRYAFGFSFFLFALYTNGLFKKSVFLGLSFLSHTVIGVFSFLFVVLANINIILVGLFYFTSALFFNLILTGFFEFYNSFIVYNVKLYDRGIGRFLLFFFSFILGLLMLKIKNKRFQYILMTSFFVSYLFSLTPYAHRLLMFPFFMTWVYFFSVNKKKENYIVMASYGIGLILYSVYVVITGRFGYS